MEHVRSILQRVSPDLGIDISRQKQRRLDAIGWASGIKEAERVAREHNRPVFLFTYDGNIATGRC